MANLTRQTQKVFAQNADADQLAVFGTMKTGTPQYSTNLSELQSTEYTEGWSEAILNDKAPYLEEMNAVQYGLSYQIAYLLQEGIPTYDANTNYSNSSVVKSVEDAGVTLYVSLANDNIGNALSNTTYWKPIFLGNQRNIGEIVTSTIPLSDVGLHLLDGALIDGSGSYAEFVSYIAGLVTDYPNLFTTELLWQQTVTQYGACGKFVYNSTNNTVRLPKITGILEGTTDLNALGDLVEAGLPNITGTIDAQEIGYYNGSNSTGAFYKYPRNDGSPTGVGGSSLGIGFNASYSNSIYGKSNTVQPQSIKVLYYIVISTSAKTDIQVDIDEIATDLNGKADVDLTNCTKPHITETYMNGSSWYRVYSDGWCEQGGRYGYSSGSNNRTYTFNLLKAYADTNYCITGVLYGTTGPGDAWTNGTRVYSATTGTVTIQAGASEACSFSWYACGYLP